MKGRNIMDIPGQQLRLSAGCILVAEPFMADPYFKRSVIFLADHNEKGSFGLILNKPIPLKLSEALESAPEFAGSLNLGGPVERSTLHFIHRYGPQLPGTVEVAQGVFWGGDFATVKRLMNEGTLHEDNIRLYIGYAGWSAGQLMDEMGRNSWIVAPTDQKYLFNQEPDDLWRCVLRDLGGPYDVLATFPEDPRLN